MSAVEARSRGVTKHLAKHLRVVNDTAASAIARDDELRCSKDGDQQ